MRQHGFMLSVLVIGAIAFGCSKSGPTVVEVQGVVTYQGKPVPKGTVLFLPKPNTDGSFHPASGVIAGDGSYSMKAFPGRKGVVPGEYLVAVNAYTGSLMDGDAVYLVPEKFASPVSSGLALVVMAEDASPIVKNFDLQD